MSVLKKISTKPPEESPTPCPNCKNTEYTWNFVEAKIDIIGHDKLQGLDWVWQHYDCISCSNKLYGLSVSISSHSEDEYLLFDGCHKCEKEHFITITKDNFRVDGHECFNVTHDNPLSTPRYQTRFYKKFAQYEFGLCDNEIDLIDTVGELFYIIIKDIRPDWFSPPKVRSLEDDISQPTLWIDWVPPNGWGAERVLYYPPNYSIAYKLKYLLPASKFINTIRKMLKQE